MDTTVPVSILIVDDKEANRFTLHELLKANFEGLSYLFSASGQVALELCLEADIDIILLDVQMPGMDGFEVAHYLSQNKKTKNIPIIFITAVFNSDEFFKKGFELGAVDYLTKPIDEKQLCNKLAFYIKLIVKDKELMLAKQELQEMNGKLKVLVQQQIDANLEKEQMLVQQSKLAAMGEMIADIAHQWKQPLTSLGIMVQDIKAAYEYGDINDAYIEEFVNDATARISFMSETIDDFRNFFNISKEKEKFDIVETINDTIMLISARLKSSNIIIKTQCNIDCGAECAKESALGLGKEKLFECQGSSLIVYNYKNEFQQVVLNLIGNAADAVAEKKVRSEGSDFTGEIRIQVDKNGDQLLICISDNGDGIPADIIGKIFDPYFTTKEQSKGSGIGLYMSKKIVEQNMDGILTADNGEQGGARFTIALKA